MFCFLMGHDDESTQKVPSCVTWRIFLDSINLLYVYLAIHACPKHGFRSFYCIEKEIGHLYLRENRSFQIFPSSECSTLC